MPSYRLYPCIECDNADQRVGSYFCSNACKAKFILTMPFVLACETCTADQGSYTTVEEATAGGWRNICPEPDGLGYNYLGDCPRCVAAAENAREIPHPDVTIG